MARDAADSAVQAVQRAATAEQGLQQRTSEAARERMNHPVDNPQSREGNQAGQKQNTLSYESAEKARALAKEQQDLADRVTKLQQTAEQLRQQLAKAGAMDSSLSRQLQEAQQMLHDALTPQLLDEMKKLQVSLPAPYNTADLANGQAKFAFCSACHTIAPGGPNMTGPNLHGVVGRRAGTAPNYNYSEALKGAGLTWDAAHLDKWLTNPRAMEPGTKMTFPGIKDPKDRTDVIAYLMVNSAPKPE